MLRACLPVMQQHVGGGGGASEGRGLGAGPGRGGGGAGGAGLLRATGSVITQQESRFFSFCVFFFK